jgi:glycosyltransferase involved in cell wall biosynthesis
LHNVESALHARCGGAEAGPAAAAHRLFAHAAERLERAWLPRFSGLLATSHEDAARIRRLSPGSAITVYPNAIPPVPQPAGSDEEAVVFSGNMEYHPNIGAVRFFRERIWPRLRIAWPRLVWRLVGRNPEAIRRYTGGDERIEVVGPVDDAVRELARSRVAVVPLLAGSGTRFKILEAWAAGVPVVSTALGAEGLGVSSGECAILADAPIAFAEAVSRLLSSPELRQRIGCAGRALFEREFTWDAAWKTLDF